MKASEDLKVCTLVEFCVRGFFKDDCLFVVEDEGGGHGQRLVGLQETDAQPALRPGLNAGRNGHHELSAATETHMAVISPTELQVWSM